jgi:putative ABC transport system permease protein
MSRRIARRLRALLNRASAEADLTDELRFHLDKETDYQMSLGHSEQDARRRAHVEFGGVERYRDESRDARGLRSIEDFVRDVKVATRALRRAPGFALISICTVALGVGMTTAVFSLVDGILLRPLPYPHPEALVRIFERSTKYPASRFSGADFLDLERRSKTLQSVAFFSAWQQAIVGLNEPVRVNGAAVSDRFFEVLATRPALGRGFLPREGQSGSLHAAVISDRFWRQVLAARSDWNTMILHGDAGDSRIVGIMPPSFSYPTGADIWVVTTDTLPSRRAHNWSVIGRLAPGRTPADTRVELDQVFGSIKAQLGKDIDAEGVTVRTLRESLTLNVRTLMIVLLGAVGFVLLVACANLASANLARGEAQQRELAVRTSLGASRARLVRQLATEKLLLSVAGGAVGVVLAWMLVRIAAGLGADTLPPFADVGVDLGVMAFGVGLAVATGLLTGILPALRVTSNLRGATASGGGGSGKRIGFSTPLVAAEIALATTLLVGAGLFVRSFNTLLAEDPGYHADHVVVADVSLPTAAYKNNAGWYGDTLAIPRFFTTLLTRVRATPGVEASGIISQLPFAGGCASTSFMTDGGTMNRGDIDYCVIDSAYFGTLGIRLLHGRGFTSADNAGGEQVAIINQDAARKVWPGVDPIGRRIRPPGMDLHAPQWLTVVGVVADVREYGLDHPPAPQMYVHYLQRPERLMSGTLVVRTERPSSVVPAIRAAVRDAERDAVVAVSPMQDLVDQSVAARRFSMTVLSAFSALALFLAGVGIYGVLAYLVVQRQREIGVRMALGADGGGIRALILGDSMRAVVPGLAIGLTGAFFATRFIASMLYGIAPLDLETFALAPLVILAVSLAAALWPASRAARVDPMIAMRSE